MSENVVGIVLFSTSGCEIISLVLHLVARLSFLSWSVNNKIQFGFWSYLNELHKRENNGFNEIWTQSSEINVY